jgi:outer membrane lipoprotein-sorting protein
MNTKSTLTMNEHPLKPYIDAVRDDAPESSAIDAAQRRLMQRLDGSAQKKSATPSRWGWAVPAAAAAVLAVLVAPLLLTVPGSNGSLAFADVQSFFTTFRTMHARMTTTMNGNEILSMNIVVDDQDRARIDSGEAFTFIVDPNRKEMLQLFHDARRAALVPLTRDRGHAQNSGLDWLAEIREYQGQARRIEETRLIDGDEVFGFRLTQRAIDMTLWATESGQPVLLEMETGHEVAPTITKIRFDFDRPVDSEQFSLDVPTGYTIESRLDER